jgi:hypothetical protein
LHITSTYWSGGNKRKAKENGRGGEGKEEKSLGIAARVQVYLRWDAWFNVA